MDDRDKETRHRSLTCANCGHENPPHRFIETGYGVGYWQCDRCSYITTGRRDG